MMTTRTRPAHRHRPASRDLPGDRVPTWTYEDVIDDAIYVPPAAATHVADQIDLLARTREALLAEAHRILVTAGGVHNRSLHRWERLLDQLRPAVYAQAELSALDPAVLLAGYRAWQERHHHADPSTDPARWENRR